jgi:hypothetical protein
MRLFRFYKIFALLELSLHRALVALTSQFIQLQTKIQIECIQKQTAYGRWKSFFDDEAKKRLQEPKQL